MEKWSVKNGSATYLLVVEVKMKQIWINKKFILGKGSQIVAYIFSIIGFIGMFAPLSDVLPKEMSILIKK